MVVHDKFKQFLVLSFHATKFVEFIKLAEKSSCHRQMFDRCICSFLSIADKYIDLLNVDILGIDIVIGIVTQVMMVRRVDLSISLRRRKRRRGRWWPMLRERMLRTTRRR